MIHLAKHALERATRPLRRTDWYKDMVAGLATDIHMPVWRTQAVVKQYDGFDVDEFRAKHGKDEGERRFFEQARQSGEVRSRWNLLTYSGASNLFECLIGNGTATGAQNLTYFNNANTYVGVGDSSTAEAAPQTDLQAASNKYRNAADGTYPLHVDGTGATAITAATNATPIVITAASHGLSNNHVVTVAGVGGNTNANGTWQVTVTDANTFSLNNSSGNASYTSGGLVSRFNVLVIQSTFGNAVANFNWNEWAIFNGSTGGRMLNRKVVSLGTKVSSASWTLLVAIALA